METMSEIVDCVGAIDPAIADPLAMWEPNNMFRCLDCDFVLDGAPTDSQRYRAENHANETGHRVGWFADWPDIPEPHELLEALS